MNLRVPDVAPEDDVLGAAINYAKSGWFVGPAKAGTKNPGSVLGKGWEKQTSRDPQVIATWFTGTDHGVFLHAGRSGAIVFDVDHPDRLHPEILRAAKNTHAPMQTTRPDTPQRGHYLFLQPEHREIGNGLGTLGNGWGEVRGKNGVIMVAPTIHPDGGLYRWYRTGSLPTLPGYLADALTDARDSADTASNVQVQEFLHDAKGDVRTELLNIHCAAFTKKCEAGESRHMSMAGHLAGAMKEAKAGFFDAQTAADTLEAIFLAEVGKEPRGEQKSSRTGAEARAEWNGLLSWTVGQALVADDDETRQRVAIEVPDLMNPAPAPRPVTASPVTLDAAHAVFRKWLGAEYDLDVLDVVLATAVVEKLLGDPVWLLVVSGSGAAKTETVVPLKSAGAFVTSTIASEGALLSGTSKRERSKDATGGFLRKIGTSGIMVIKDVTTILSMDRSSRGAVLAALREIYDGYWERNLGSDGGQSLTWEGRIVVIGAVTTAWDKAHEVIAAMGDRFVLVRLDSTKGRTASGRQAIANTGDETAMREELGAAVAGVLATVDTDADLTLTHDEGETILTLADIVTLGRTGVEHDYRGDVIDAHAPEMPTRFAKQLTQILRGGIALGIDRERMLRIVARCAADSMPPLRLAALIDVHRHADASTTEVRRRMDKPRATVDRTLQALHMLGMLTCNEEESSGGGRTTWRYTLAEALDVKALEQLELPGDDDGDHDDVEKLCQKCGYTHAPSDPCVSSSLINGHGGTNISGTSPTPSRLLGIGNLPGRCDECEWHLEKQGHAPNCQADS